MSPLEVVDELRDQAEELLGVLVRSLAELDLEEGERTGRGSADLRHTQRQLPASVPQLLLVLIPEARQHNQLISSISG